MLSGNLKKKCKHLTGIQYPSQFDGAAELYKPSVQNENARITKSEFLVNFEYFTKASVVIPVNGTLGTLFHGDALMSVKVDANPSGSFLLAGG